MSKKENIALHIAFICLLLLAFFLSEERLYADSGYYLLRALNHRCFWIEHDRVVLVFSQILPLIGSWLNASLQLLITLYSLGHVLFFYILFLITLYLIKNKYAAIALLLLQLTGITQSYFTPQFELYYGVGLLVVFYAILSKEKSTKWEIGGLIILEMLIISSHPMNIILLLFVLVLDIINKDLKFNSVHVLLGILLVAGTIGKVLTFSPYEQEKINYLLNFNRHEHLLQLKNLSYFPGFLLYMLKYYWDIIVLFILSMIYYRKSKNTLKPLLIILFFVGYILLINITYFGLESGRYMEQVYFPMVPVIIIPLVTDVLKNAKKNLRLIIYVTIITIMLVRTLLITGFTHFPERTSMIKGIIAYSRESAGTKFIVDFDQLKQPGSAELSLDWSLPVESLLLSAQDGPDHTVSIISQQDIDYKNNIHNLTPEKFIFTKYEINDITYLDHHYFMLHDDPYKKIEMMPEDMINFGKNVRLSFSAPGSLNIGQTAMIRVTIQNNNPLPIIGELRKIIKISYHWYRDEKLYLWDGIRTPLQVNIYKKSQQSISIGTPDEPGRYKLVIEMMIEDRMWFANNEGKEVIVN
jgi:hypothetical protein